LFLSPVASKFPFTSFATAQHMFVSKQC
jgi:hypothetical protein